MKNALATLAAAASLAFVTSTASASPIVFDSASDSQARRVVNVVFAEYLQERVGVTVETAVVDLNNDRTGEIFARFVHTGSCVDSMTKCRTVVIRHEQGRGWRIVLDRMAASVDYAAHSQSVPGPLKLDGVTWKWGKARYEPDGSTLGETVSFKDVPAANSQSFAAAFGQGAQKLAAGNHGVKLKYSDLKVADGAETLLVKMEGSIVCGDVTGCPVRLLQKNGDTWAPVLSTTTKGDLAVTDTVRAGYKDLVVKTDLGFAVLGWNGSGYAVADRLEAVKER